ncbi:hypothetical protein H0H93_013052 [Arthromyces matolae]|nr:hypothetical protein H0H93_013052 [Arthromyces matolae]
MAVSSSLNSIQINPRTPKTPRSPRVGLEDAEDAVELSLLGEHERTQEVLDEDEAEDEQSHKKPIGAKDQRNMVLLCILYLIQGVPLGLALGSVPFLLREHLSYSQLATFSLASYPYSLKLLWSPIVDSVYIPSIGRRKSWILPMQLIVATLMLYISMNVKRLMDEVTSDNVLSPPELISFLFQPAENIVELSTVFTSLVFFSATQDIAVDGWALTLLSQDCLSYASTCQTIGLNTGFFASFTVFLAFNSAAFAQKWGVPQLTLEGYLKFWSIDKEPPSEADMSITAVYKTIWTICKLRHVQVLVAIHLVAKIGFAANEAVTSLKMVEKGFKREDLALVVLIDFPFQIVGGWLAAKWSRGDKPLRPWLIAFIPRLVLALIATLIVLWFPAAPISTGFFLFLIIHTILSSFASTVQFVGISAFHTRISDPLIGGTYMTLLNTFTNMGGTWPKWFVLKGVDLLSDATCKVAEGIDIKATECVSDHGKALCKDINGVCITHRDGYYTMSALCMILGVILLVAFIVPKALKLQVKQSFGKKRLTPILLTSISHLTLSILITMSSTTMHFGPEWMRPKHQAAQRTQPPPSPPPGPTSVASTYSALLSPAPPQQPEKRDEFHPFRYSREELLRIYREGGGKGGLGLEVERWEGVVREAVSDPIGLREMGDAEKKGPLNSDLRRRQSTDVLSPLSTQTLGNDRSRHNLNSPSSAAGSPLRDRFGSLRRDQPSINIPRKQSLSNLQPASPREAAAPSPRRGSGFTSGFDGILGGDSWIARRRASEASLKAGALRDGGLDHQTENKTSDIQEEEEQNYEINELKRSAGDLDDSGHIGASQVSEDLSPATGQNDNANVAKNSKDPSNTGSLNNSVSDSSAITLDLATVEWSYKDPSGQVQGPFNAELMQKWFDGGYFTGDLPMKRTHLDTQWFTVDELVNRHGGNKIFLTPPTPSIPPGLPLHRDIANPGQDPLMFNGPYQPAPVRTLRSSTLDNFGSSASNSPSSSLGRFGNGSPDPNAFAGSSYYNDNSFNGRTQAFNAIPDPSAAFNRRNTFNDMPLDASIRPPVFGNVIPNRGPSLDGFGYNRTYSPGQAWNSGHFEPNMTSIDPFSSPFGPTLAHPFGMPQDIYNDGSQFQNVAHNAPLNGLTQQQQYTPSPAPQYQTPSTNSYGATPQTISSELNPSGPSQSPWHHETHVPRRAGPFDSPHPTAANTIPIPAVVEQSPWGATNNNQPSKPASQTKDESSPWQPPSETVVEDWKAPPSAPDSLTFSNIVRHNQQQQQLASPVEAAANQIESVEVPAVPVTPAAEPEPARKTTKTKVKAPVPQTVPPAKAPVAPQPVQEPSSVATPALKAAWSKEDDVKSKPSGAISLRDIQEAEVKKAENKKVAERERERVARAAVPVAESKDAGQPFTASWGLPTSQTGSRSVVPTKEASNPSPAAVSPAPVWTHTVKAVSTKKTMKEIQEEEELRKKNAVKEAVVTAPRRAYAETTQKVLPTPSQAGTWTTVGANGKASATPAPTRQAVPPSTPALSVPGLSLRPNGAAPVPRPVSVSPVVKTSPLASKADDLPLAPSSEFLKWLSNTLRGLNSSVNGKPMIFTESTNLANAEFPPVEEIMEMLISFPIEPDQATIDTVADAIYINSTTLDGRRFAAEFFSKRKSDAARTKGASAGGKSSAKPVSIADVVKAVPKPTQPEWGFKVVNKKKKGGRA